MLQAYATVKAQKADKYIATLAKHFAKKVTVDNEHNTSLVYFPMGTCQMNLSNGSISFICEAKSEEELDMVKQVITSHVLMLKEFKNITIDWQNAES